MLWTDGFWAFSIANATQGNPAKIQSIAVPAITADVFNDGAVLVYLMLPNGIGGPALTHWTSLPFNMSGFAALRRDGY